MSRPRPQAAPVPDLALAESQRLARVLWVHDLASPAQVCAVVGISTATLAGWRERQGWDALRRDEGAAWGELRSPLRAVLPQLIARIGEAKEAADVARLAGALKALLACAESLRRMDTEREHRRVALRFSEGFEAYIVERDSKGAGNLVPHLRQFARQVALGRPD